MNAAQQARAEVLESLKALITEIDQRVEARRGVIAGSSYVVQTSPGLYLVPNGAGFGVGGITSGVVMWDERIASVYAHNVRKQPGGEGAKIVHWLDALAEERAQAVSLIDNIESRAAA